MYGGGFVRTTASLTAVALLAVSCGASSSDSTSGEDRAPTTSAASGGAVGESRSFSVPEELVVVVDGAITAVGGDEVRAALALIMAADRGYDRDAVFTAAATGRLTGNGVVVDGDGNIVGPTGVDHGVIIDKPPLEVSEGAAGVVIELVSAVVPDGLTTEDVEIELEFLQSQANKREVVRMIVILYAWGYSIEQIVAGLVAGDRIMCELVPGLKDGELDQECSFGGTVPDGPQVGNWGQLDRVGSTGSNETVDTEPDQNSDDQSPDASTNADASDAVELADGSYFGAFDYDYSLFWSIAPDNLHDNRDTVEENSAELVVSGGEVQLLTGAILTNFPEGILPDSNIPFCGTNSAFDLTGDPGTAAVVDGGVTIAVEITATRQGYGGGEYGNCETLDWEVSAVVTATITPVDSGVSLSLENPNGGYTLNAVLPAG